MNGKSVIHAKRQMIGLLVVVVGMIQVSSAKPSSYTFLKLADVSPKRQRIDVRVQPNAARAEVLRGGGLAFSVQGDAEARAVWSAPIDLSMKTSYTIDFSTSCENVASPARRPNVFIRLTPLQKGIPSREIPVFAASGNGDELGQITMDLSDQVPSRAELVVDLSSKVTGKGMLKLSSFTIAYVGNLLSIENDVIYAKSALKTTIKGDRLAWMESSLPLRVAQLTDSKRVAPETLIACGFGMRRVVVDERLWRFKGYFDRDALRSLIDGKTLPCMLEIRLTKAPAWWRSSRKKGKGMVSDFNPEWKTFCREYLTHLFSGLDALELDTQVPAVTIITGAHDGSVAPIDRDVDPNVQVAYGKWLKKKYGSVEALRSSLRDPDVDFNAVKWVPASRWPRAVLGPIMAGSPTIQIGNSKEFYHSHHIEFLTALCDTTKSLTKKHVLCGALWHPQELDPLWDNRFLAGPESLKLLAGAESVDFLELAYSRIDLSSVLAFPKDTPIIARIQADDLDDVRLAWCGIPNRIKGVALSLPSTLFADGKVDSDFADIWRAGTTVRSFPSDETVRAAFVYDPAMLSHLGPQRGLPIPTLRQRSLSPVRGYSTKSQYTMHSLYALARTLWSMSGIAYHVVSVDELTKKSPYELLVFAPILELTEDRRERLSDLRRGGRVLVWSWASGLLQNGKMRPTAISDACGMTIKLSAAPGPVTMHPTTGLKDFLGGQRLFNMLGAVSSPFDAKAGLSSVFLPSFSINDPKATVLAVNSGTKKPALAYRKFFRWHSVYCASPIINPEIVRACALKSSIHVYYSYNEPSRVTDRFILISPLSGGKRSISLPKKGPLFEVFSGMELSATKSHQFKVKKGRTYLFFRGDKREWETLQTPSRSNK